MNTNKSFLTSLATLLLISVLACSSNMKDKQNEGISFSQTYSDYFVFIAADEPLVVPFDFNWYPAKDGYNREFKSWYGTKDEWPMAYLKDYVNSTNTPQETWELTDNKNFKFNEEDRTITIKIDDTPKMEILIPKRSEWTAMPIQQNNKEIFAFKTSLKKEGRTIDGWMVYERIRLDADFVSSFGGFKAFYWVPLVINGNFFHFEWHKGYGHRTATKWYLENDNKEYHSSQTVCG